MYDAAILSTPDSDARLRLATELFVKQASISEVSKKIASAVDESLSKQQKEFFLRQQLAAIQRELHTLQRAPLSSSSSNSGDAPSGVDGPIGAGGSELDDDEQHEADDMADLKRRIEAMEVGSEERKMGVREWRRLKRIPAGSVENGVIRTYVCAFYHGLLTWSDLMLPLHSSNGSLQSPGQTQPHSPHLPPPPLNYIARPQYQT